MNYRLNSKAIALVAILVVVAVILFAYTLVSAPTKEETPEATTTAQEETPERIITAKQQFVNGMQTIAGTVDVPTPCHSVVAQPFFVNDATNTVEIRFNTAIEGEQCAAQVTSVPFKVSFEAPEDVSIRATWDGQPVRLNLVPVAPGESIGGPVDVKG